MILNKMKIIVSSKYFAFPYGRTCDNANEALIKAKCFISFWL